VKIGTAILLLLVGIICGATATHFYKERSLKDARAKVAERQATLDSLKIIITRDSTDLVALNERIEHQRDSLNGLLAASEAKQVKLAGEVKTLGDSIEDQLPDELRPAFFRLRVGYEDRIELLEADKVALNSIIVSQDTLIESYKHLNATLHDALARSEELKKYWEDEAKRDWWEKPQFTAPLAVGATLAVVTVTKSLLE